MPGIRMDNFKVLPDNKPAFQKSGKDSQAAFPEGCRQNIRKSNDADILPYLFVIREPVESPLGGQKGDRMAQCSQLTRKHVTSSKAIRILDAVVRK